MNLLTLGYRYARRYPCRALYELGRMAAFLLLLWAIGVLLACLPAMCGR